MNNVNFNGLLMTDFYKACHMNMYDPKITKMVSYLTPRSSRIPDWDKVVFFGLTNFVNKYLVNYMNEYFFTRNFLEIINEYHIVLGQGLNYPKELIDKTLTKVKELHDLGYLPICIKALKEGTLIPMGVPCIEISTTHPNFAWVGQAIESLLSCEIWHPMISSTVAYKYRQIAHRAYSRTSDKDERYAMADFSMRGQESLESAISSSAAFLTSFFNSSTVPARQYLMNNYRDGGDVPVYGLTSTEHSVMCSDYAINGNEKETYRKLLTEIYPETSFSAVCDSYDFWNVVCNILPELRNEIEKHKGFIGIRHDSDEPVHALCGIPVFKINNDNFYKYFISSTNLNEINSYDDFINIVSKEFADIYLNLDLETGDIIYITITNDCGNSFSGVFKYNSYENEDSIFISEERSVEEKGLVEVLYELFGGVKNSKGFLELNPKVKAVYGDSITLTRAEEIFKRLENKGFAADTVSLGVGSFSMQSFEGKFGKLFPFTRDTFSIAIKCTYLEYADDDCNIFSKPVFKDPKGFDVKKSQKGLCRVYYNENNELTYKEYMNEYELEPEYKNEMMVYFYNGSANINLFSGVRETINLNLYRK